MRRATAPPAPAAAARSGRQAYLQNYRPGQQPRSPATAGTIEACTYYRCAATVDKTPVTTRPSLRTVPVKPLILMRQKRLHHPLHRLLDNPSLFRITLEQR